MDISMLIRVIQTCLRFRNAERDIPVQMKREFSRLELSFILLQ